MLQFFRRNGSLIILAGLSFGLYSTRTVPAQFRNQSLRLEEEQSLREVQRLEQEAERMRLQLQALEQRDPAALSRIVHARLLQGRTGLDESETR